MENRDPRIDEDGRKDREPGRDNDGDRGDPDPRRTSEQDQNGRPGQNRPNQRPNERPNQSPKTG